MQETIEINVTAQELEVIGQGLAELPFKIASPIMDKLSRQYQAYEARKQEAIVAEANKQEAEVNKSAS